MGKLKSKILGSNEIEPEIESAVGVENGLDVEVEADTTEVEASQVVDPLEAVRNERDEFQDLLQRKQAEFENYRKRINREKTELRLSVEAEVLGELLAVLDACEAGIDSLKAHLGELDQDSYIEGYELLLRQILSILQKYNVEEVPGVGSTFDPNVHEAVIRDVSKDYAEDEVVEQFRKGYVIGDRLLRPAQVKVSVWPEE
ncbi:MAG: nucleotide exchange factor GrpE [Acidobacteriota bacterium]|nr:MAG: nucleotide exchange factor GrpE [Acidobacteriota bacterium]